jgi:uncharacterized cupredoxin-like copper-binding protein
MFTNRSILMKLALAFAVMLIAAACSGGTTADDDDGGSDLTTTTATAEEAGHTEDEAHAEDETHTEEEGHAEDEDHAEDGDHEAADADRVVSVTMSEFAFDPAIVVTAGETVTFVVTNAGVVEHEFRLSNAHRIEEHIASGHEGHDEGGDMDDDMDMDEGGHHEENADVMIMVPAGETAEVTVTFPDDTTLYTDVACLIPGHYEAGMHAELSYDA